MGEAVQAHVCWMSCQTETFVRCVVQFNFLMEITLEILANPEVSTAVLEQFATQAKQSTERSHVDRYMSISMQNPEWPIIDVRSPVEYTKGHVPSAVNLPLFTDEERATIGTFYKNCKDSKTPTRCRIFVVVKIPEIIAYIEILQA